MVFGTRNTLIQFQHFFLMEHPWTKLIHSNILDFGLILNFPLNPTLTTSQKEHMLPLVHSIALFIVFHQTSRKDQQLVLPIIDYADIVNQNTFITNLKRLNVAFNSLCRFVLRCPYRTHHCLMYQSFNWLQPEYRRKLCWTNFLFECIHFNFHFYLKELLIPYRSPYSLRHT